MKILSIGSDRNLFKQDSAVGKRVVDYGKLVDELHIIVFTTKKLKAKSLPRSKAVRGQKLSANTWVYPTNSASRWLYIRDAINIGKQILKSRIKNTQLKEWLVTSQDPFEAGLAGGRIAQAFNLPLQLQVHTDFLSPYFIKESLLNRIRTTIIARFTLPRASCIRVASSRIKKSIISRFPFLVSKTNVLPIYVNTQKIKNTAITVDLHKKYGADFIILMASRLTREKNIGMAIEAFSRVNNQELIIKNPLLLIVGDGSQKKKLKAKSRKLKADVRFENAVRFETLVSYYKTADLFLLTSSYEGYGMALVEAASAGCPVVTTDVGIADLLTGATVIPVNNSTALARALANNIETPKDAPAVPLLGSYQEYLVRYKKLWQQCLL